jgi:hypothetical protein
MPSAGPYIRFEVYATVANTRQGQIPAAANNPQHVIEIENIITLPLDVQVHGNIQAGSNSGLLSYVSGNQSWSAVLMAVQQGKLVSATERLSRSSQPSQGTVVEHLCCVRVAWRASGAPGWSQPIQNPGCSSVNL